MGFVSKSFCVLLLGSKSGALGLAEPSFQITCVAKSKICVNRFCGDFGVVFWGFSDAVGTVVSILAALEARLEIDELSV